MTSLFILLHLFYSSTTLRAEILVKQLLTSHTVLLSPVSSDRNNSNEPKVGDHLLVFSQGSKEISGFLIIQSVQPKPPTWEAIALVHYHSKNTLILAGDRVEAINFHKENGDFHGRADLLVSINKKQSSKYKPLVYQGISNSEAAATLQKNESMLSIFGNYHYGISDQWSLGTMALANVIGVYNLSTKFRFLDSEEVTISQGLTYANYAKKTLSGVQLTSYFDLKSNAKIISHTAVNLLFVNNKKDINGDQRLGLSSSIESGYEYIFDNWDRLLLGPRYNLDKKSVGGFAAYIFIWHHLHITLGIRTSNFTNIKFDTENGYTPLLDAFWRF